MKILVGSFGIKVENSKWASYLDTDLIIHSQLSNQTEDKKEDSSFSFSLSLLLLFSSCSSCRCYFCCYCCCYYNYYTWPAPWWALSNVLEGKEAVRTALRLLALLLFRSLLLLPSARHSWTGTQTASISLYQPSSSSVSRETFKDIAFDSAGTHLWISTALESLSLSFSHSFPSFSISLSLSLSR